MICIEFLYFFNKKWTALQNMNGMQVVPFIFNYLEIENIDQTKIDSNSLFRFILYPDELINEDINYLFKKLNRHQTIEYSKAFSDRCMTTSQNIYKTDVDGENLLEIDDNLITLLKNKYNDIINGINVTVNDLAKNWQKHTVIYWKFKYFPTENITIEEHNLYPPNKDNTLELSLLQISQYEQIYHLITQYINELP